MSHQPSCAGRFAVGGVLVEHSNPDTVCVDSGLIISDFTQWGGERLIAAIALEAETSIGVAAAWIPGSKLLTPIGNVRLGKCARSFTLVSNVSHL